MSDLPQLYMRRDLEDLPPMILPEGMSFHTQDEQSAAVWEAMISESFGFPVSYEKVIVEGDGFRPENVFFLCENGQEIATTTAAEKAQFPGEGWLRMVASLPSAQGKGAGRLVCLRALYALKEEGYPSVVLSTDDFRLPAIRMYLRLGFQPLMTHESHPERWEKVFAELNSRENEKKTKE